MSDVAIKGFMVPEPPGATGFTHISCSPRCGRRSMPAAVAVLPNIASVGGVSSKLEYPKTQPVCVIEAQVGISLKSPPVVFPGAVVALPPSSSADTRTLRTSGAVSTLSSSKLIRSIAPWEWPTNTIPLPLL